jgi:hypothetical protein
MPTFDFEGCAMKHRYAANFGGSTLLYCVTLAERLSPI